MSFLRKRMGSDMSSSAAPSPNRPTPKRGGRGSAIPTAPPRMPQPEHAELEKRFTQVLAAMDLPPDKAKLLKSYDDEKKWDIICDQERVTAKQPPSYYLDALRVYLDPKGAKSAKKRVRTLQRSSTLGSSFRQRLRNNFRRKHVLGDDTSTQTLRNLETSLRTNQVQWVREFLSEESQGLDVLIDYLKWSQEVMREEQLQACNPDIESNGTLSSRRPVTLYGTQRRKMKLSNSRLNFGDAPDDVHVCIMCLRAIMNHQYGFNLVFAHKEAINCIALSLNHHSARTKALVLELLAAVCLVRGGHEIILKAFDNFKIVCIERYRFQTMMNYFRSQDDFHIDFMVACMQFINIVVHSVEDMNFRVHLQHEFTLCGLDEYLEKLRNTESDRLSVQVNAYLDNMIDVATLLEDSDTKNAALERVMELEELISRANERIQEIEVVAAEFESKYEESATESSRFQVLCDEQESQILVLESAMSSKEQESLKRQSMLEDKLQELDDLRKNLKNAALSSPTKAPSGGILPPPPPPVAGPPPPPPPPPPGGGPPPPPPPPGFGGGPPPPPPAPGLPGGLGVPQFPGAGLTIKKLPQPKSRLPVLNWVPMKPMQVRGTVFAELDDEKLYQTIDFHRFEDQFRLGSIAPSADTVDGTPLARKKSMRPETVSLLESNRLRNVAITRRKIVLSDDELVKSINSLDLKTLSLERVEILQRVVPTEAEVKALREYERDKRPLEVLADEDRFMLSLMRVERIGQKLHIMSFIGNFFDSYHHLQPQLNSVIAAAKSVKNSDKVKKILEIILAFGNYMNGAKRGATYGFKLQSLDMLLDAKSNDKKTTLLHFIVQTIQEKFPELRHFEADLRSIEKAASVSLENVVIDIRELEKGMTLTEREYEARKDRDPPLILKDFLNNSQDKMRRLKVDAKNAQDVYLSVVEYYGENPKTLAPNTFFSFFVRFINSYRQAEKDLEAARKLEEAQRQPRQSTIRGSTSSQQLKENGRQSQDAIMNELKNKQKQIRSRKVINRDEVYHGALEDILLDLKSEPYRREDGMRRSQRRRVGERMDAAQIKQSDRF